MTLSVDVVIPTLGVGEFLLDAIHSVAKNSCSEMDLRIIVVFDGEVPKELPRLEVDVPLILMSTGTRVGSGAASNLGLKSSQAQFVARMDADDLSVSERLYTELRYLSSHPEAVLVTTSGTIIDDQGRELAKYPNRAQSDARTLLLSRNPLIHSSFVMRRADFEWAHGYDEECVRMQDYDLALRLALKGRIAILNEQMVKYRVHPSQTGVKMHGYVPLMIRICRGRMALARELNENRIRQAYRNLLFAAAQMARYLKLRRPRYEVAATQSR